eukprot:4244742-Pyramimonas_sp.AAC.1
MMSTVSAAFDFRSFRMDLQQLPLIVANLTVLPTRRPVRPLAALALVGQTEGLRAGLGRRVGHLLLGRERRVLA